MLKLLCTFVLSLAASLSKPPKQRELIAAKFSLDGAYYRLVYLAYL